MIKIYLVKKDVNKPAGEGNWITMTPYEFAQFMKTPEGHERRKCFAQLDACDYDDDIIIADCDEQLAKIIRAEKDAHDYLMGIEKEIGYTVFSYNEQEGSEDDLNGEELLKDENVEVENEATKRIMIEKMMEGIQMLSEKELHLIKEVYLSDNPISANQYAQKYGISISTAYARLDTTLKKIKNFLNNKK